MSEYKQRWQKQLTTSKCPLAASYADRQPNLATSGWWLLVNYDTPVPNTQRHPAGFSLDPPDQSLNRKQPTQTLFPLVQHKDTRTELHHLQAANLSATSRCAERYGPHKSADLPQRQSSRHHGKRCAQATKQRHQQREELVSNQRINTPAAGRKCSRKTGQLPAQPAGM